MPRQESLGSYLDALAGPDPTPGGGAAAALTLAQAAALLAMVCRLTRPERGREALLAAVLADALAVGGAAQRLADADCLAFRRYMAAAALPKSTPAEAEARTRARQAALADAARVPLAVLELSAHLRAEAGPARVLAVLGNPGLRSDVTVALHLAEAALLASKANVEVNLKLLKDAALVREIADRMDRSHAAAYPLVALDPGLEPPHPESHGAEEVAALVALVPQALWTTDP